MTQSELCEWQALLWWFETHRTNTEYNRSLMNRLKQLTTKKLISELTCKN